MKKVTALFIVLNVLFVSNLPDNVHGKSNYLKNIEMVPVKGDCFQMGPVPGNAEKYPAHKVCVSDFKIGRYEVTQGIWEEVMGDNPSHFKLSPDHPVEMVSWHDIQLFLEKLNDLTGKQYRLPTEAEWEYACLSGGRSELYCGSNEPDEVAWFNNRGGKKTKKVGTKKPNGFGLFDMSGNVDEWVQDLYKVDYYLSSPVDDPAGPAEVSKKLLGHHVIRGGEWACDDMKARSRYTSADRPDNRRGLRLAHPN